MPGRKLDGTDRSAYVTLADPIAEGSVSTMNSFATSSRLNPFFGPCWAYLRAVCRPRPMSSSQGVSLE